MLTNVGNLCLLKGYGEHQYHPTMESPQQNVTNRIVQFSENSQLVTVENQHFQRPPYDQNFDQANNQYQTPQNMHPQINNNVFPNQYGNSMPKPNFPPQSFPAANVPQNVGGYPPHEFHQPQNTTQFQNYDNQNNWNQPHQAMNHQTAMYPQQPNPPQHPPMFPNQQQIPPRFRPPFNNQNRFRPPRQAQYSGEMRGGTVMKRLQPMQASNSPSIPVKQMRFEHSKQKTPIRTNLQEIKTVDNLPDTTTAQEPEPEIEEDEETKQYRLKIAEQKALREKVLREKEARRLASIIEKQKNQESQISKEAIIFCFVWSIIFYDCFNIIFSLSFIYCLKTYLVIALHNQIFKIVSKNLFEKLSFKINTIKFICDMCVI